MEITPELVTMRRQEAELIFNTYTGIQVPKSAVKINTDADGNQQLQGVYILAGNMAVSNRLISCMKRIHIMLSSREQAVKTPDWWLAIILLPRRVDWKIRR